MECFFVSLSAVAIPQSLHHTFITAGHLGLMINQIMLIWKDFSVTFSYVKVWALFSFLYFNLGCTIGLDNNILGTRCLCCKMPSLFFGCSLLASGFQFDYVFDWTILKYQQSQIATPPARAVVSDGVLSRCINIFIVEIGLFQQKWLLQGPAAGPSSGMPPAVVNADGQSGIFFSFNFTSLIYHWTTLIETFRGISLKFSFIPFNNLLLILCRYSFPFYFVVWLILFMLFLYVTCIF